MMHAPFLPSPLAAAPPSLEEAWLMFLEERKTCLSPTSLATDYRQVGCWIHRCPIQELEKGRQIITWTLQQKPEKSARKVCMFLRCMYKWASSEDVAMLPRNPVQNFRMPKAPQADHDIVVIPRCEIPLVLIALEYKGHHRQTNWSLYAEYQLQTGKRTGEVRAAKWSDIDGNKIRVHSNYTLTHGLKNSTKTNKARWVPLNQRALQILEELDRDSEFIFPWNRFAYQTFFRMKVDQLFEAGLVKARYRPYDLRHVAISRWLEDGISVAQAAKWAGNTSEVIWKHYAGSTKEYNMPVL